MGPPTDPRPSGSARVPKWSVHPCTYLHFISTKGFVGDITLHRRHLTIRHVKFSFVQPNSGHKK
ncbi:unnamed protein product [Staurois parvus]|uniref:Uncharacterized protein n=1 Tax=Staurois parvus TaxID=386267 RepID=A0ABN9GQW7_9NEOB|nr:unnamed protein product [Staurois parvus]